MSVRSTSRKGSSNRILGVGTIQIFTAGDQPEFTIVDMPDPHLIRKAIAKVQDKGSIRAERRAASISGSPALMRPSSTAHGVTFWPPKARPTILNFIMVRSPQGERATLAKEAFAGEDVRPLPHWLSRLPFPLLPVPVLTILD